MKNPVYLITMLVLILSACTLSKKEEIGLTQPMTEVKIVTTMGDIKIQLYNETPKHRDNFIQLVKQGAYDSIVFHRAIKDFIIQAGDMSTRISWEKEKELIINEHLIEAEFDTSLFHKRGSIATARTNNPKRSSSGTHFYVNIGKPMLDSIMDQHEARINKDRAFFYRLNLPENKSIYDRYSKAMDFNDYKAEEVNRITDSLKALTSDLAGFVPYHIPEHHRKVYRTLGGNPFHDQRYVVFGEVSEGMEVVDAISLVPVDEKDWPLKDVHILSAEIIN